jgi:hypothetical protein
MVRPALVESSVLSAFFLNLCFGGAGSKTIKHVKTQLNTVIYSFGLASQLAGALPMQTLNPPPTPPASLIYGLFAQIRLASTRPAQRLGFHLCPQAETDKV